MTPDEHASPVGNTTGNDRAAGWPGWRGRTAATLLGLTTGVGINLASNFGFRVLAIAAAGTAVVMVTNWMRELPRQAPLVRFSTPALLCLAGSSSLLTLVLPDGWADTMTLTSAGFLAGGILLASGMEVAAQLLAGAALLGLALAVVASALAAAHATWGSVVFTCYVAAFGLILLAPGVHLLRGRAALTGVQIVGLGAISLGGAAIGFARGADVVFALVIILGGATLVLADENAEVALGSPWTVMVSYQEAVGFTWCAAGVIIGLSSGVPSLLHGQAFDGCATIVAGAAVSWAGVSLMKGTRLAQGLSAVALGLIAATSGTLFLLGNTDLPRNIMLVLAIAVVSAGLGTAGASAALLHRAGLIHRVAETWRGLLTDPSHG